MAVLTVTDLVLKKTSLERTIRGLLHDFSDETGIRVHGKITIKSEDGGGVLIVGYDVDLQVDL